MVVPLADDPGGACHRPHAHCARYARRPRRAPAVMPASLGAPRASTPSEVRRGPEPPILLRLAPPKCQRSALKGDGQDIRLPHVGVPVDIWLPCRPDHLHQTLTVIRTEADDKRLQQLVRLVGGGHRPHGPDVCPGTTRRDDGQLGLSLDPHMGIVSQPSVVRPLDRLPAGRGARPVTLCRYARGSRRTPAVVPA